MCSGLIEWAILYLSTAKSYWPLVLHRSAKLSKFGYPGCWNSGLVWVLSYSFIVSITFCSLVKFEDTLSICGDKRLLLVERHLIAVSVFFVNGSIKTKLHKIIKY